MNSCVSEEEFSNSPQGNFDALWQIVDEHYCFFPDKAAEYAADAREKAGEAAKAAAIGFIRGLGTRKKEKRQKAKQEATATAPQASAQTGSTSNASDIAFELRTLKELLDEGIITQEEFDAKKRQLLGL